MLYAFHITSLMCCFCAPELELILILHMNADVTKTLCIQQTACMVLRLYRFEHGVLKWAATYHIIHIHTYSAKYMHSKKILQPAMTFIAAKQKLLLLLADAYFFSTTPTTPTAKIHIFLYYM